MMGSRLIFALVVQGDARAELFSLPRKRRSAARAPREESRFPPWAPPTPPSPFPLAPRCVSSSNRGP